MNGIVWFQEKQDVSEHIKIILFWTSMVATMLTTLLMIVWDVPLYMYTENTGGIPFSAWWLLNGIEAPIIIGFLVRFPGSAISFGLLVGAAFYLGLECYMHLEMTEGWDLTAKFELVHILLFLLTACLALFNRKYVMAE
jgi:hypothetical protein